MSETRSLRIMLIEDVQNDEDLQLFFKHNLKVINYMGYQLALGASALKASLGKYDRAAGQRRRHLVSRPLALAAATIVVVARLVVVSASRFRSYYAGEIANANRRQPRSRPQDFKFGD